MIALGPGRIEAFEAALAQAQRFRSAGEAKIAFSCLERAHVLGQIDFVRHLCVHWQMLLAGWATGDQCEVLGQLLRIALVPIGHLTGRLPHANIGGASISAFKPTEIPPDLRGLFEEHRTKPGDAPFHNDNRTALLGLR